MFIELQADRCFALKVLDNPKSLVNVVDRLHIELSQSARAQPVQYGSSRRRLDRSVTGKSGFRQLGEGRRLTDTVPR